MTSPAIKESRPTGGTALLERPTAVGVGGRRVLLPLALVTFVTALDGTVVTVAAPSIRADLGLSLSALEWVAAAYLLAFGGLMLVGGRLCDLLGRRLVLALGLLLFGASSVLVALAPSAVLLLAGRGLQGTAAALLLPAAFALVAHDLRESDRHLGVAVGTVAIGSAIALGPVVGGTISQFLHWSVIFWLNVPVVVAGLAVVAWAVPASARATGRWWARLDVPGLTGSAAALLGVTFVLVEGPALGFGSTPVRVAGLVAVLGAAGTVLAERRAAFPLLDVALVRHRMIAGSFAGQLLWGLGVNGVVFFTSLFLQDVLRLSPARAGLVFVPLAVAVGVTVPFVGGMVARWGSHRVVATGMVIVAAGFLLVVPVGPGDSVPRVLPGVVVIGLGSALTTPMSSAPMDVVPLARAGVVAAVLNVAREVAGVLGLAVTGAVVASRQAVAADPLSGFLAGYRLGLVLGAVLALAAAVVALRTLYPGQQPLPPHPSA